METFSGHALVYQMGNSLMPKGRVLLVVGNWSFRGWAARVLTRAGYEVVEAVTAKDAVTTMAVEDGRFDVVINEMFFRREMNGPTLVRALRRTYEKLDVIYVSGYCEKTLRDILDKNETYSFLQKPCRARQLAEKAKDVFGAKD